MSIAVSDEDEARQMQTEETERAPALGHLVRVSGSDHEDGDVSQGHQQVLSGARLSIRSPPCRLEEKHFYVTM